MLKRSLVLTFIIIQVFIIKFPDMAYSRNWIVYHDGTGDAPTIQAAIDSASASDSISIMPGEYDQECIRCEKDSLTIIGVSGANNTILQNNVGPPGIMDIGQLFRLHSNLKLKGITFKNSWLALYIRFYKDVIIEDCIFYNNAIYALVLECSGNAQILSNLFYRNQGGMCINSTAILAYNTISNNSGEGIFISDAHDFNIYNNLIADNNIGIDCVSGNSVFHCNNVYGNNINYRGIADPTGQDGNISIIPQFCLVDPCSTGSYYLQSDSPCAPGNHPDGYECGIIGAFQVGCGTTAIQEESWGTIKSRFKQ